jgi:hypothetical protein
MLSAVWIGRAWNVCRLSNKYVGEVADIARRNMRRWLIAVSFAIHTTCNYGHTRIFRSSVTIGNMLGNGNPVQLCHGFWFQVNYRRISASSSACQFSGKSRKCLASQTRLKVDGVGHTYGLYFVTNALKKCQITHWKGNKDWTAQCRELYSAVLGQCWALFGLIWHHC